MFSDICTAGVGTSIAEWRAGDRVSRVGEGTERAVTAPTSAG